MIKELQSPMATYDMEGDSTGDSINRLIKGRCNFSVSSSNKSKRYVLTWTNL